MYNVMYGGLTIWYLVISDFYYFGRLHSHSYCDSMSLLYYSL